MDLRSLRNFITVVDTGSLTRAAASTHLAQPALTAQIKRLEADLDVRLLERSSTGVIPTVAGRQLYEEAVRLLADADALRARISQPAAGPEGVVTMAVPVALVLPLMGRVVVRARTLLPRVRIHLVEDLNEAVRAAIVDGRAEFGLIADPPEALRLHWRPLAVEPLTFAGLDRQGLVEPLLLTRPVPRSLLTYDNYPTIRFADAITLPLVMQSSVSRFRKRIDAACDALGLRLNVVHEYDSFELIRAVYAEGVAFTFAPAGASSPCAHDPVEVRARVIEPDFDRTVGIAWLPGRQLSAAALAVIDLLRDETAAAIRQGRWVARSVDRSDYRFS